ncbi:MAG TPA: helicase [Thermodesulfobium narugense]|nr:helicase [Thermodesulfobium narugense]
MYIITNQKDNITLEDRLKEVLQYVEEFKILVGYFYFSGLEIIYEKLKENPNIKMKVLVGLEVGKNEHGIYEYGLNQSITEEEQFKAFLKSLKTVFSSKECDNQEFEKKANFFFEMMQNGRLEIRKTKEPNHAKLYILKFNQNMLIRNGLFIVGSSNLTMPGLRKREEFNVEISDFGLEKAEQYFDSLWDNATKITEREEGKEMIKRVVFYETPLAQITPYQAYVVALKHYIDTFYTEEPLEKVKLILENKGYKVFKYQIDAVNQALNIINEHGGVIIADVVGLGKSITTSVLGFVLGEKGIVITPPGLIENWEEYLNDFDLYKLGWKVYSTGKLEDILEIVNNDSNIKVVVVDEAHNFRNEDTKSYDLLSKITRGKKVILLTATPFNNRPSDVFSLIKLFQIPKKSTLTLDGKVLAKFKAYEEEFEKIRKNSNLSYNNKEKRLKALSKEIKSLIQPIIIRRNRIDLKNNPIYKKEISELPKVEDPQELLYGLTEEQLSFYNEVIENYFGGKGTFKGAIYVPYRYQKNFSKTSETNGFIAMTQENLRNLMRRLLIRRFESSFASFKKSIENFLSLYKTALTFIEKTNMYVLDRKLLDLSEDLEDEALNSKIKELIQETEINDATLSKKFYVYQLKQMKEDFIKNIKEDIELFKEILEKINTLKLLNDDPKAQKLIEYIRTILNNNEKPKRKIIVFSEFTDTIEHLKQKLDKENIKALAVNTKLNKALIETIKKNFDASLDQSEWEDDYDVLLATNRLAEGFNLARAGVVVNYDIPWNPVKVIQRVGRINRIGQKVFDSLYIVNFFPTKKGEGETKQKKIAQDKLLLIHNSLGEDAKIFSPDEQPTASELYNRLTVNPDEIEEESFLTKVLRDYQEIKEKDPEILKQVENLPPHIKVSKRGDRDELIVLVRKNSNLYVVYKDYSEPEPKDVSFEEIYEKIKEDKTAAPLEKSNKFWEAYEQSETYYQTEKINRKNTAKYEREAVNVLRILRNKTVNEDLKGFIENLIDAIMYYGIIPTYTLVKLSELNENNEQYWQNELERIKKELGGKDFLKTYQKENSIVQEDIIIAIENRKLDFN